MPTSSVLIGSHPAIPATTLGITANAVPENLSWSAMAGGYLYHPTAGLSIVTALETLLNTHSELSDVQVFITESGYVRITSSVAFALTGWGSDTTLRDLLGATTTLSSGAAHLMPSRSPLIWVPGKPDSSEARMGSDGILVKDTYAGRSAPGQVVATTNNTWRRNRFWWGYLNVDQVETVPDANGTWAVWWDQVASRYRRFNLYRDVAVDLTDDITEMDLTGTRLPSENTYIKLAEDGPLQRGHDRQIERLELYCRVELSVETATEYGA